MPGSAQVSNSAVHASDAMFHIQDSQLSRDAKRASDAKHKWRLGAKIELVDGQLVPAVPARPYHGVSQSSQAVDKLRNAGKYCWAANIQSKALARRHYHSCRVVAGSDFEHSPECSDCARLMLNNSHLDFGTGRPEGEPDAGIAYSFDSQTGPSDGSDVLSQALGRAVERFEDKKTKKLVSDEYDVVSSADDQDIMVRQVEEDFEMLGPLEA